MKPRMRKTSSATRDEFFWQRVSKSEGCWEWTGAKTTLGYGQMKYRGDRKVSAYRYSWELKFGEIPEGALIDHLCHNNSCVRPEHLRLATHQMNMANRRGAHSTSQSGVRGVWWEERRQTWCAEVRYDGKRWRKRFPSLEEASRAASAKRQEVFSVSN